MTDTLSLLLSLIRAELCDAPLPTAPVEGEALKALYMLAKRHDVAHIAGNALGRAGMLPDGSKAKAAFEKECYTALYRYERITRELASLTAILEENGITHLPLKGSVLRPLYAKPWMRTSCDIDVLVKDEDIERARGVLLAAGYRPYGNSGHDISFDSPLDVHIEMHFRLMEEGVSDVIGAPLADVWEHAHPKAGRTYEHVMTDAMFYYYHVAHMAKHYLHGGCGIRPFLDIYVLKSSGAFDTDAAKALLARGELSVFTKAAEALSDVWFRGGEHTPITRQMEAFVLSGGVYGTEENRITVGQARRGGKIRYALSRIFLPYHTLKYHYPSLQKHKWLFPFFQVRRWFKLLFLGGVRRSAKELKTNSDIGTERAREIKSHIEDLGL